jgi:hypothetical protein
MFSNQTLAFAAKPVHGLSAWSVIPAECPDDVLLGLDMPGVVGAHAFGLVADETCHLARVGTVAPPPSGIGQAQTVQRGAGANVAGALPVAQPVAHPCLHLDNRTLKVEKGDRPVQVRALSSSIHSAKCVVGAPSGEQAEEKFFAPVSSGGAVSSQQGQLQRPRR